MTLLAFLREKVQGAFSVKALKRAIDAKQCLVNGRVEFFSTHRMKEGDEVILKVAVAKKELRLTILYEDDYLLICDKSPGITCDDKTFNAYLPDFEGCLELIHRLDKETSGVVLVAKKSSFKEKMIDLFSKKEVHKTYFAIVDGEIRQEKGEIENYLAKKHVYEGGVIYGPTTKEKGKRAITLWKCLKKRREASLVQCEPITGRTHQIRVHLSGIGHPVLGDYQYGKRFLCKVKPPRHMLHASRLEFVHPETG